MVDPQKVTAVNGLTDQTTLSKPANYTKRQEGTLELTIKKAELTGEQLPQFTQSYVYISCQGQKNRTPNAAQKDQHKPVWNATIRMPLEVPVMKFTSPKETDEREIDNHPEQEQADDDEDRDSATDSDDDDNFIFVEVFFQEMGDTYTSYGQAKLSLLSLCGIGASSQSGQDGSKGGWLQLEQDAGKVLYSAQFKPRELPKMIAEGPDLTNEREAADEQIIERGKDHEGDTDMAEEFKKGAAGGQTADQQASPIVADLVAPKVLNGNLGQLDLEDEDGDTLQNEASGGNNAREGSISELIEKYQHFVQNPFLKNKKNAQEDGEDEETQEPNQKFVTAFDSFSSFMKAAIFIEDWIRTKKNNVTDFANDFPAVLNRGLLIRNILLYLRRDQGGAPLKDSNGANLNPEVRQVHQLIFTKELHASEDDYTFYFIINLLEACSIRYNVPVLVIRIALNHLGFMIQDGAVTIKAEHQKYAMGKLGTIRSEVIHDYVKHLKLQVSSDYFLDLTRQYLNASRYVDAATCIMKFGFYDKFDILELCINLVDISKVQQAKMLVQNLPELKERLIRGLSRPEHAKVAAQLVKDYKLNPDDFPELQNLVSITSSNYFIKRAFKSPSHAEYMPLHKIEDLFSGNPRMLLFLVDELLQKGNLQQAQANGNDQVSSIYFQKAAGVWQRHNLAQYNFTSENLQREMARIKYNAELDDQPVDQFGPVSEGPCLRLPNHVEVKFIGNQNECQQLRKLIGKPIVGMDSEWRPTMTKFDSMRPALLQLSDENVAYLVDLVALAASPLLDNILTEIFTHPQTLCIGFSFKSDLDVFARHFPTMKFYKLFANFIDAQTYYGKVCIASNQSGLAKVTKHLLNEEMCKGEQMSNWERRPLRLSQQHYAALDAFCLIEIINILAKMAVEKGDPALFLEKQKHPLNWLEVNRSHNYHHGGGNRHRGGHHGGHHHHHHNRDHHGGGNGYHGGGGYQGGHGGGYGNHGGYHNRGGNQNYHGNNNSYHQDSHGDGNFHGNRNNRNQGGGANHLNKKRGRGPRNNQNNNHQHHGGNHGWNNHHHHSNQNNNRNNHYQPVGGYSNQGYNQGGQPQYVQRTNTASNINNNGQNATGLGNSGAAAQHNPFANYQHQNQQPFQPNAARFNFN